MEDNKIKENKDRFISLLKSITRQNARIDDLINKLENSDFFVAPASTKYHGSERGGLCAHSLCVYANLIDLVNLKGLSDRISHDSIIIVSLLHDFSKMNFYEPYFQNKKVYSPKGSKFDDMGNFDWVSVPSYKIKDINERFVYGSHEETSEYMARCYIPLTYDESVAILHHMGQLASDSAKDDIYEVYKRCPLAFLLNTANMMSICVDYE